MNKLRTTRAEWGFLFCTVVYSLSSIIPTGEHKVRGSLPPAGSVYDFTPLYPPLYITCLQMLPHTPVTSYL